MRFSIVSLSECVKYSFGYFLWSPEFFQKENLSLRISLQNSSSHNCSYYFEHVKDNVDSVNEQVICYDLMDGLHKFFDGGVKTNYIGSTKKLVAAGDFVISRLGAYLEEMGIIEEKESKQVLSTEFLVFRRIRKDLSVYTLFALCMTEVVQKILRAGQYGTIHSRFYGFLLEELPIPDSLLAIDSNICATIKQAIQCRKLSRKVYGQAQDILLSELGLTDYQSKHQLTFIKKHSDTKRAGRIDAEYYQPKYEDIIKAITNYSGGWHTLEQLVHIRKCIEVGSDEYLDKGIPFVRVSNISPFEMSEEKYISSSLYNALTPQEENIPFEKSKSHQPRQGEILFSKDATPGIAYYLKDEPQKMIISGGILRLKSKTDKVNNEYLTLVLNSILIQEQVNRDVGGSVILHWRPDQVKETVIPILSKAKQIQIQKKIAESFRLCRQSKDLLESAKKAVEMVIEQDEQTAIKRLKKMVLGIDVV